MTDSDRFEDDVNRLVDDLAVSRPPAGPLERALAATSRTRPLPRWIALVVAPPMGTGSVLRAGSPSMRLAAFAITVAGLVALTLGAIVGGVALFGPSTLVVAQDGSGDYRTINEAVEAAADGDIIEVREGRYVEDVHVIGKDLTIRGDGDQSAIVVEAAPADRPSDVESRDRDAQDFRGSGSLIVLGEYRRAFLFEDTTTTLSDMTLVGGPEGSALEIIGDGAAPTLERLELPFVGDWLYDHASIWWAAGGGGVLRDSHVHGIIEIDSGASPLLFDNDLEACIAIEGPASEPVLDLNRMHGCPHGFLVHVSWAIDSSVTLTRNDLSISADLPDVPFAFDDYSIFTWKDDELVLVVEDNTFHDTKHALRIEAGLDATIAGNIFERHETALEVHSDRAEIRDNRIFESSLAGINVLGSPLIAANDIERNEVGVSVGSTSGALIRENRFCGNGVDIRPSLITVEDAPEPTIEDNTSCPDDTG